MKSSTLGLIALILVIIGGINWGLIGIFQFDLVARIFGATVLTKIVYILVGISAVYLALTNFKKK